MKKKNILIFTAHPAQIHNFRYLKNDLERAGHKVYWLATEKDISKQLLKEYNINYTFLHRHSSKPFSKIIVMLKNLSIAIRLISANNIDMICSRLSPYAVFASLISRKAHLAFIDTESSGSYNMLLGKMVNVLITARSFKQQVRRDQIRFDGNKELFYLHPNRFRPSPDVLDILGIKRSEPFVVMRFVSWEAHHDKGLSGFSYENKLKATAQFARYARVFISSEKELPEQLAKYQINIPLNRIHDVLAFATLFLGESATMASESAVLGTPAIYLNDHWPGSLDEEEKHGLLFAYKASLDDQEKAIEKGLQLLQESNVKEKLKDNYQAFLHGKIDVTAFFAWLIDSYPASLKILHDNPAYQDRF